MFAFFDVYCTKCDSSQPAKPKTGLRAWLAKIFLRRRYFVCRKCRHVFWRRRTSIFEDLIALFSRHSMAYVSLPPMPRREPRKSSLSDGDTYVLVPDGENRADQTDYVAPRTRNTHDAIERERDRIRDEEHRIRELRAQIADLEKDIERRRAAIEQRDDAAETSADTASDTLAPA